MLQHPDQTAGLAFAGNTTSSMANMAHLTVHEAHKNIGNKFHRVIGDFNYKIREGTIDYMSLQTAFEVLYVVKSFPLKFRHIFLKELNVYLSLHPFWNDLEEVILGVQDQTADSYLKDLGQWAVFLFQNQHIPTPSVAEVILGMSEKRIKPEWVRDWIHFRARKGLYPSTLRRNYFGLQYFFKLNGYDNLNTHFKQIGRAHV